MRDLEAPWVGGDYDPMSDPERPAAVCDYCGDPIYAGDSYMDIDGIMCAECVRQNMKEAV